MRIRTNLLPLILLHLALGFVALTPTFIHAQTTAFTYQGRLSDSGGAATGSFDLQFQLFDAASSGSSKGTVTVAPVSVSAGLFTVSLDFGSGSDVFPGADRWVEIGVRPNGNTGAYSIISPRTKLTPTPYAIRAANVADSGLSANVAKLDAATQTFTGAKTFSGVTLNGTTTFGGNFSGALQSGTGRGSNATDLQVSRSSGTQVASGDYSVISGGKDNTASNLYSTVAGGQGNAASSPYSAVTGGQGNTANNDYGSVGGGYGNNAAGLFATIPGGHSNFAQGNYSFAGGHKAKAAHLGSFVWGDSTDADVTSQGQDTFVARAAGGYILWSNSGATVGVQVAAGGNAFSAASDRNLKENFHEVDGKLILERVAALPIQNYNLKSQNPSIRHVGAMAQDFAAAFNVGEDDKHISTADADGVALAAIQGLHQIVKEKDAKIESLEKRLAELEKIVGGLSGKQNSTP